MEAAAIAIANRLDDTRAAALAKANARIAELEAKLAEARELLQAGLRYAWNCEGDPNQPAAFRARAEVWMADVQYLIGKATEQ